MNLFFLNNDYNEVLKCWKPGNPQTFANLAKVLLYGKELIVDK